MGGGAGVQGILFAFTIQEFAFALHTRLKNYFMQMFNEGIKV